uniref:Uncharacterized protein n=1 Tax=Oryza meridionalis TaxID=40149 RepID=A0A0E0DPQ5_9ORYZ
MAITCKGDGELQLVVTPKEMSSPDAIRGGVKPRVGLSIVQLLGRGCGMHWTIHIASRPFRFDPTAVVLLDARPFSFDRTDAILLDDVDQPQNRKLVITTLNGITYIAI